MTINNESSSVYDVEAQIESDAHGRARERKHLSERALNNLEKSPHQRQGSISMVELVLRCYYAVIYVEMLFFCRAWSQGHYKQLLYLCLL